jgi:hypothetical protein
MSRRRALLALVVILGAVAPYLPTIDDYFVQDDFGVVGLLSTKPATSFPRWFVSPWMDEIWGEPPDELRPFPAVSYQVAALLGAGSPVANHVINIGFHAVNAWLVFRIAEVAVGLTLPAAALAGLVFAVLPMQAESVAWVTGRVDSMPACFYLASFLLFHLWRTRGGTSRYGWSVALCFVALFTKQNTVTLPLALVVWDLLGLRRPVRASWEWIRPYVPFVLLTGGYLGLRYAIFGEVAREGRLGPEYVNLFFDNASIHLRRMIFGEAGLSVRPLRAAVMVGAAFSLVAIVRSLRRDRERTRFLGPSIYFLIVWVALGLAPTIVAGYGSPRHMYLASVGWAVGLGAAYQVLAESKPRKLMPAVAGVLVAVVLAAYVFQLHGEVRLWGRRSAVSRKVVSDIEREAAAVPRGTLLIVDPPQRSSNFTMPYAVQPPFTSDDVAAKVSIVSHSSIHCCASYFWEPYTRKAIVSWMNNPDHPPVVALRWDPQTGALYRLRDADEPFLRTVVALLLESKDVASLDRQILSISSGMVLRPAS